MMKEIKIYRRDGIDIEKKNEKLIAIKWQLEKYYEYYEKYLKNELNHPFYKDEKTAMYNRAMLLQSIIDTIWEIVKDEQEEK